MSRVSILLTNYNGLENLQACLPGVMRAAAHQGLVDEVLVVDDCSSDESLAWLAKEHPDVRVVALKERSGFLGAANAGFAAAKNRLVALLSNDMVPREDFLVSLLPHFADPELFAVSSHLKGPGGDLEGGRTVGLFTFGTIFLLNSAKAYRPFGWLVKNRDDRALPSFFTGGNALYDRDKFRALGGFDPIFHPFYWEDTDMCYRAWKRGWRVLCEPASIVTHHQRMGTIKKNFDRGYIRGVRTRNRYLFIWKNFSLPYLLHHAVFLVLLVPTAWIGGNLRFYSSLWSALAMLGQVLERRRAALPAVRTDREILKQVRSDDLVSAEGATSPVRAS